MRCGSSGSASQGIVGKRFDAIGRLKLGAVVEAVARSDSRVGKRFDAIGRLKLRQDRRGWICARRVGKRFDAIGRLKPGQFTGKWPSYGVGKRFDAIGRLKLPRGRSINASIPMLERGLTRLGD